jgi:hypothetical protein
MQVVEAGAHNCLILHNTEAAAPQYFKISYFSPGCRVFPTPASHINHPLAITRGHQHIGKSNHLTPLYVCITSSFKKAEKSSEKKLLAGEILTNFAYITV